MPIQKFGPQWKDRKSTYQVKQILPLFCNLIALILGQNYVKGHRVTKIFKQIMFEGAWVEIEAENYFRRQLWTNLLRQAIVFM